MSEYTDPPLRLKIEGLRWMGEEFEPTGDTPAELVLHSTDSDEESVAILRGLRKIAARRLWMALAAAQLTQDALDFDAPNAPTEDDLRGVVSHIERALAAAQALVQLAPEIDVEEETAA